MATTSIVPCGTTARRVTLSLALAVSVVALCVLSLSVGSSLLPFSQVWSAVSDPHGTHADYIVRGLRLTRTLIGLEVGVALGVAGALMQAITRNPLAEPGLLGVTSGASLAIVLGATLGLTGPLAQHALAGVGACGATALVYMLGTLGKGASPVRLVLAGVAINASIGGIIQGILLTSPTVFDAFRFWDIGALTRTDMPLTVPAVAIAGGLVIVAALVPDLSNIALGEDVAAALGTNVARTRALALVALTILAGAATAVAGPISFVGLIVPLAVRHLVGPTQGWIVSLSGLAGPVLVLSADILGRVLARPGELQVGLLIAFVGAPVLAGIVFSSRSRR